MLHFSAQKKTTTTSKQTPDQLVAQFSALTSMQLVLGVKQCDSLQLQDLKQIHTHLHQVKSSLKDERTRLELDDDDDDDACTSGLVCPELSCNTEPVVCSRVI